MLMSSVCDIAVIDLLYPTKARVSPFLLSIQRGRPWTKQVEDYPLCLSILWECNSPLNPRSSSLLSMVFAVLNVHTHTVVGLYASKVCDYKALPKLDFALLPSWLIRGSYQAFGSPHPLLSRGSCQCIKVSRQAVPDLD